MADTMITKAKKLMESKKKDSEKIDRRQFLNKVVEGTKLVAVAVIASELIDYFPSIKATRPDLLPGSEGDYYGV